MVFGWSFAGGWLSLGSAVLQQLCLELCERNWALPPSERQDQVLRAGPSLWSHGMKAAMSHTLSLWRELPEGLCFDKDSQSSSKSGKCGRVPGELELHSSCRNFPPGAIRNDSLCLSSQPPRSSGQQGRARAGLLETPAGHQGSGVTRGCPGFVLLPCPPSG